MASNPTLSQIKVGNVVYDICDTSARNSINTLKDKNPSSWFMTVSAQKSVPISSGGAASTTITVTPNANYTSIAATGWNIHGGGVNDVWLNQITSTPGNNNVTVYLKNPNNGARTPTVTVYMLCINNKALS